MPLPPTTPRRRGFSAAMPGSGAETLQVAAIVVAVLYFAREMLIPIVLAVLLSFVLAPLVRALGRFRVPRVAAVLLVVALGFGLILGLGAVMGRQATSLAPTSRPTRRRWRRSWRACAAPGGRSTG